jgi:hypothetical protein
MLKKKISTLKLDKTYHQEEDTGLQVGKVNLIFQNFNNSSKMIQDLNMSRA